MPFGIGHRMCIGKQFAIVSGDITMIFELHGMCFRIQMEVKVMMVHLLRTFHVTLAQDYKLEIGQAITLHPKGGVPCSLIERD